MQLGTNPWPGQQPYESGRRRDGPGGGWVSGAVGVGGWNLGVVGNGAGGEWRSRIVCDYEGLGEWELGGCG